MTITIGLLGFELAADNKGCEALGYSMFELLRLEFPEADNLHIRYFHEKSGLGSAPEHFPWWIEWCPLDLKHHPLRIYRDLRACDVIIDATYGDSFADIYIKMFTLKLLIIKEMAVRSGATYISAPQTYGPFESRFFERVAADILKKSNSVFSRDDLSSEYVERIAQRTVTQSTDMAFALPYESRPKFSATSEEHSVRHVGVNVSGLLWKGGFSSENQFELSVNYRDYVSALIDGFLAKGVEVHLIPHVIATGEPSVEDDYEVCQELTAKYRSAILPERFTTASDVKSYIGQLDFFTGARMHSTIGAFSAGVPVVPFSYSRKFEGLFKALDYPYVLDGKKLSTKEAVEQTLDAFETRSELRQRIDKRLPVVNQELASYQRAIGAIVRTGVVKKRGS